MARNFSAITHKVAVTLTNQLSHWSTLSIAAWFNAPAAGSANFDAVWSTSTGNTGIQYKPPSGKFLYSFGSVGSGNGVIVNSTPTGWHHVCATFTVNTSFVTYVDGVVDVSAVAAAGPFEAISTINFGNDGFSEWFNGNLADIAMWSVQLTATEVLALSNGVRPHRIRPLSLIGYWPLDGIESPEPDLSGLAQNGTLTGTTKGFGPPITMFTPRWPINLEPAAAVPSLVFQKQTISVQDITTATWTLKLT